MKSVEDLQREMAAIRHDLPDEVEDLLARARTFADWRYYVRHHPWMCIAVAAALGFLMVPKRRRVIRLDPDTVAEWADHNGVDWHSARRRRRGGGMAQRLIETAARTALGVGAGYLGRQMNSLMGDGSESKRR